MCEKIQNVWGSVYRWVIMTDLTVYYTIENKELPLKT